MDSDQHQQIFEIHQAVKGFAIMVGDTDLAAVDPGMLYFLLMPVADKLEGILREDALPHVYPKDSF